MDSPDHVRFLPCSTSPLIISPLPHNLPPSISKRTYCDRVRPAPVFSLVASLPNMNVIGLITEDEDEDDDKEQDKILKDHLQGKDVKNLGLPPFSM